MQKSAFGVKTGKKFTLQMIHLQGTVNKLSV